MTPTPEEIIQKSDHDLLIQLHAFMLALQVSMISIKEDVGEMRAMCGQRLPHCLQVFATDKRLDLLKLEVIKDTDSLKL